ncbi:glycosyl hydrolase family 76-domain-containing protein [Aspergillus tetrazonus]
MRWGSLLSLGGAALLLQGQLQHVLADIPIEVTSKDSLKEAGKTITGPMWEYYLANQTEGIPGKLTDTWYVAGAMFMTMIQFWHVSGYNEHNSVVSHDLMFQAGRNYDYFDSNYSQWLGNDDQMFWGLATITASETGFPEVSNKPTWTSLARAVFNMQANRWDERACDGGITWQIHPWQAGYTLRNSISNGGLFQLAARLGRFTNNQTYFDWAEKIWDWAAASPLIDTNTWFVADSTSGTNDCVDAGRMQWSYNYGTFIAGAAYMYNATKDVKWRNRTEGLVDHVFKQFFPTKYTTAIGPGTIFSDVACEPLQTCDRNMLNFKGWSSMWLAMAAIMVPELREKITPKLQGSALAIGRSCDGSSEGKSNLCGSRWYQDTWDGIQGLEVQQAALGGITANLMLLTDVAAKTIDTNPGAKEQFLDTYNDDTPDALPHITTGDRVGSWILTVLWGSGIVAAGWWLVKQQ